MIICREYKSTSSQIHAINRSKIDKKTFCLSLDTLGCSLIFLSAPFFCFFLFCCLSMLITDHCLEMAAPIWQPQLWRPSALTNSVTSEPVLANKWASLSKPHSKFLGEGISLSQEDSGVNFWSRKLQYFGAGDATLQQWSLKRHFLSSTSENGAVP